MDDRTPRKFKVWQERGGKMKNSKKNKGKPPLPAKPGEPPKWGFAKKNTNQEISQKGRGSKGASPWGGAPGQGPGEGGGTRKKKKTTGKPIL